MLSKNEIKQIASLGQKKHREDTGLFVAEGEKLCKDLIRSDLKLYSAYSTKIDQGFEIAPEETMRKIAQASSIPTHLAVFHIPKYANTDHINAGDELILALDEVQDPGNLGTILRTACWFGLKTIVCSTNCADAFNPKVVQASMGAISKVRIFYTDLPEFLSQNLVNPRYGTFLEGESVYEARLSRNGIIVLGNEGKGISPEAAKLVDRKLFIPCFADPASGQEFQGVESLNVASAAAILCSEFKRR